MPEAVNENFVSILFQNNKLMALPSIWFVKEITELFKIEIYNLISQRSDQ